MISRRSLLAGVATTGVVGRLKAQEAYPAPGHPGHWIQIRGKNLYVDVAGPDRAPVLVYVHGGPGTGSYDFALYQREKLSAEFRLVLVDQRGALRSEAIGADEPFKLQDIVDDFEALRSALHIPRWSMIAFSFGGLIGTRYALQHPHSVDKLIFENPTFDIGASDHSMLEMIARGYDAANMPDRAAETRAIARQQLSPRETWRAFAQAGAGLGVGRRLDLYAPSLPSGYFFEWIKKSGLSQEMWLKGSGPSQATLWRDDACFESLLPRLTELRMPCLLIKGRKDFNTGQDQLERFQHDVHRNEVVWFENSGHIAHAEEPERFAEAVTRFAKTGHAS